MMSVLVKIAWRNIVRNRRRPLMTASAVAAGALAMLLFLGYTTYIFLGMETGNVQHLGHVRVFRAGYFLYGAGNPTAYGIDGYRDGMRLIGWGPRCKGPGAKADDPGAEADAVADGHRRQLPRR